jgi:hypothetical protein
MKLRHVIALSVSIALALPLAVAGPASAAPPFPYHDAGQLEGGSFLDTETREECGLDYDILTTVEVQGNHFARPVRDGVGQAWYGHDNTKATFTNTRVGTDDSFSVTFKSVWHEVSADHLEGYEPPADYEVPVADGVEQDGPYYEFVAFETVHATVRDDSGRVVSRERTVIRWHVIFNTLGDSQPGGDVVVEFEPEIISGDFVLQDFCSIVREQLG